jgi:hypothetical protein
LEDLEASARTIIHSRPLGLGGLDQAQAQAQAQAQVGHIPFHIHHRSRQEYLQHWRTWGIRANPPLTRIFLLGTGFGSTGTTGGFGSTNTTGGGLFGGGGSTVGFGGSGGTSTMLSRPGSFYWTRCRMAVSQILHVKVDLYRNFLVSYGACLLSTRYSAQRVRVAFHIVL